MKFASQELLAQVGHTTEDGAIWAVTPEDVHLPHRDRNAHKGDFGKVCIFGGQVGYSGAPIFAARAAERTGAGLVTVLVPEPVWAVAAEKLDGPMPWPLPSEDGGMAEAALFPAQEKLSTASAALLGPGLGRGDAAAQVVRQLISTLRCPLVLDADGINALEGHIDRLDERVGLSVLTPHPGEFLRAGGELGNGDRVDAARRFAKTHRCVMVLKGHHTVTAFPDGDAFINTTGNPGMAKGGSGDVLAGMILALLGQGLPPKEAVPWAVCLHGQAGDIAAGLLGEYSMTPSDLVESLPAVLKRF